MCITKNLYKEIKFKPSVCAQQKIFFLFLNPKICCGYSKEPSQRDGSFEHPKHLVEMMGKKIITIYPENFCLSKPISNSFYNNGLANIHVNRAIVINPFSTCILYVFSEFL